MAAAGYIIYHCSSRELQARMQAEESISLHIRRGDYVSDKRANAIFSICSLDYYRRAIDHIDSTGSVYVFSDDIAWARENLESSKPLVFVDSDPARDTIRDLWLMSQAHHHIIANSSYSWWGAWLAGPDKGATIAPQKWYNDPAHDDRDMIPTRWRRM